MSMSAYFLPAKSVLADAGVPDEFYRCDQLQILGVKLMLDERRRAAGIEDTRIINIICKGPGSMAGPIKTVTGLWAATDVIQVLADNDTVIFDGWSSDIDISAWVRDDSGPPYHRITVPAGTENLTLYANFRNPEDPAPTTLPDESLPFVMSVKESFDASHGLLSDFHVRIDQTIVCYINTIVHPGGEIQGAGSITLWADRNTLMAAFGIGVDNAWTVTPARNPFGLAAAGGEGYDFKHKPKYKEHINELAQVLDKLQYTVRHGSQVEKESKGPVDTSGAPSSACDDQKSQLVINWNAATWDSPTFLRISRHDINLNLRNVRGKVQFDTTGFVLGDSLKVYFNCGPDIATNYGNSPPTSAASGTFGFWAVETPTPGGTWTSGIISPSQLIPEYSSDCSAHVQGWAMNDQVILAAPAFQYTL